MKVTRILGGLMIAGLVFSAQALAADYRIDTKGQHAFISFKVGHLGFSLIDGRFNRFEGQYSYDAENPGASRVEVTIQANSIDTNHAERDKHLRSSDFLDVDKYPTIKFESNAYLAGEETSTLKGNLTLRNITRPVEIKFRKIGEGKDPWGGYRSGFRGQMVLNSADFGLVDWVGDIEVEMNIEGVRL